MKTIFIGTTSQGKLKEFTNALKELPVKIINPKKLKLTEEPEETGKDFYENAILKARWWSLKTGLPVLVDDSGLIVDSLNGKPGIHSKRFHKGTPIQRNQYLLRLLSEKKSVNRSATYICALAFHDPQFKKSFVTQGICTGQISQKILGSHGFGYDPIFIPSGYQKTFGQLPETTKAKFSHRAKAIAEMLPKLRQWSLG